MSLQHEQRISTENESRALPPGTVEYLGDDKPVDYVVPLVSICVTTYQHARYIEQCLGGMVSQQADFPYEVLVGEDGSDDGTREICKRYAESHPDKIRLFLHDRASNYQIAGKPTGKNNFINNLRMARGRFLAFCDGDDFWTSPSKLQRQVDALNMASQSMICFHKSDSVDEQSGAHESVGDFGSDRKYISLRDILNMSGGAFAMSSIMLKREVVPHMLQYAYEVPGMHFFMQALGVALSPQGGVYLPEVMSCYRKNSGNSISRTLINTRHGKSEWTSRNLRMLDLVAGLAITDHAPEIARAKRLMVLRTIASGHLSLHDALSCRQLAGIARVDAALWLAFIKSMTKNLVRSFRAGGK